MVAVLTDSPLSVRAMTEDDLEPVLIIEERSYDYPWTAGIFSDCMRIGYACHVIERATEVLGYGILSAGAGEAHVLNLCVDPLHREQGVATELLDALLKVAARLGARTLFLEVRPSNGAARRLYKNAGFAEIGVRRNYYPASDGREDALVLSRALPKAATVKD